MCILPTMPMSFRAWLAWLDLALVDNFFLTFFFRLRGGAGRVTPTEFSAKKKTPKKNRWDDLWLNEGFASWMQTYAADELFPEWGMWEQFVVSDQQAALRLDSLRSSHPIQVSLA